ncbi:MAG: cyanophycinase [Phycisphaerae bacterium]
MARAAAARACRSVAGALLALAGPAGGGADGAPPAVVVLAGGGREAEIGDHDAWSARLYRELLAPGDRTGDGRVSVALLAVRPQSEAMPDYFRWLGADVAANIVIDTPEAADDPALDDRFANVDAIFVKGGEQGRYYDCWNDRRIEQCVRRVVARGGAIGGTSAGAMALAEFALAGSMSLTAPDVLADAHTRLLDDATDGGSGVQTDWFGFVPGVLVDTHVTQRGRLGRTAGALARAIDDSGRRDLLAIAIDQQTGVVIRDRHATVVGRGAVEFLRPGPASELRRTRGAPLVWTDLRLDRLTDGWTFDLAAQRTLFTGGAARPDTEGAAGTPRRPAPHARFDPLTVLLRGDCPDDERALALRLARDRAGFALVGVPPASAPSWLAVLDAHASTERAWAHEAAFAALAGGAPGLVESGGAQDAATRPASHRAAPRADIALLCGAGARMWSEPTTALVLRFGHDEASEQPECAALVIDATHASHRSLATHVSLYDRTRRGRGATLDGRLRPATIVDARLHILADTLNTGLAFDLASARVVAVTRH